jgi:hypothetical protein
MEERIVNPASPAVPVLRKSLLVIFPVIIRSFDHEKNASVYNVGERPNTAVRY